MCINGACSPLVPVKSGVVQGSVVGPLLFTLFINSMQSCVIDSTILLYADDSKLIRRVDANGHVVLNNDLQNIVNWSQMHGLPLNVCKCCVIHCDGRHASNNNVEYTVNDVILTFVNNCTDLGITR